MKNTMITMTMLHVKMFILVCFLMVLAGNVDAVSNVRSLSTSNNLRNPSSSTDTNGVLPSLLASLNDPADSTNSGSHEHNPNQLETDHQNNFHRELFFNWFCGNGGLSSILSTLVSLFTLGLIKPSNNDRRRLNHQHQNPTNKDLAKSAVDLLQNPENYSDKSDQELQELVDHIMKNYEWNEEENHSVHGRSLFGLFGNCGTPQPPPPPTCQCASDTCSGENELMSYTCKQDGQCTSSKTSCGSDTCDGDKLVTHSCHNGKCSSTTSSCQPAVCTGKNELTSYTCLHGQCTPTSTSCGTNTCNGDNQIAYSCENGQCKTTTTSCGTNTCDGNDLTSYFCQNGQCSSSTGSCGPPTCDGNRLVTYFCKDGQCTSKSSSCGTNTCNGNDLTSYTCHNGQCVSSTIPCGTNTCNGNNLITNACEDGQCTSTTTDCGANMQCYSSYGGPRSFFTAVCSDSSGQAQCADAFQMCPVGQVCSNNQCVPKPPCNCPPNYCVDANNSARYECNDYSQCDLVTTKCPKPYCEYSDLIKSTCNAGECTITIEPCGDNGKVCDGVLGQCVSGGN